MKKKYFFIQGAEQWNRLLRKFYKLYKRIYTVQQGDHFSAKEHSMMLQKLQNLYKRLQRMQHSVGLKLAGTALSLMLASATCFSQEYIDNGFLISFNDLDAGSTASPGFADIDGDNDLDLFVGELNGHVQYYTNDGTGVFTQATDVEAG